MAKAKKICAICEKQLGALSLPTEIQDGFVCLDCLTFSKIKVKNAMDYNAATFKEQINQVSPHALTVKDKSKCAICGKSFGKLSLKNDIQDGVVCLDCLTLAKIKPKNTMEYNTASLKEHIKQISPLFFDEKAPQKTENKSFLNPVESPVLLKAGETAYLFKAAVRYITKHKVVGKTASTAGASLRLGKVSIRAGGIQGQSVWADVTGTFPGEFVLTNQRIVFIAAQHGFECKLSAISAITQGDNGIVIISTAKDTYNLHLIDKLSKSKLESMKSGKKEKVPVITDAYQILTDMIRTVSASER